MWFGVFLFSDKDCEYVWDWFLNVVFRFEFKLIAGKKCANK